MDQLKDLFSHELAGEPPPPPGDLAQEVMRRGIRLRRQRTALAAGTVAAGFLAVAATVAALGLPGADQGGMPAAAPARCTVADPVGGLHRYEADQVAIFLRQDVTDAQRVEIFDMLQVDPLVRSSDFETKEQAFEKFRELWSDNPDLVDAVEPQQLPEAFRVNLTDPSDSALFAARMERLPGVDQIVERSEMQCTADRPGAGG